MRMKKYGLVRKYSDKLLDLVEYNSATSQSTVRDWFINGLPKNIGVYVRREGGTTLLEAHEAAQKYVGAEVAQRKGHKTKKKRSKKGKKKTKSPTTSEEDDDSTSSCSEESDSSSSSSNAEVSSDDENLKKKKKRMSKPATATKAKNLGKMVDSITGKLSKLFGKSCWY